MSVLDQPTVDWGGVSRGMSVAIGCWLFALQRHFNGTSMALQRHFKRKKERKKEKKHFVNHKKKGVRFFTRLLKCAVLDQPTVDSGGVSRERSVTVTVDCCHFNDTSTALQWHFNSTSMALQRHFNGISMAQKKW